MNVEDQFKKDLLDEFPHEYKTILGLVEKAIECETSQLLSDGEWSLSLDVEKQHCLQFYYHMAISKPVSDSNDIEINVSYENGINNGTQMIDYCLEGSSLCSPTKEVNVIVGIEPDWRHYELLLSKVDDPEFLKRKIEAVIKYREKQILKLYKNKNYDDYVTGGGSSTTDKFYSIEIAKLHDANIFWRPVFEVVEVDRVFV